MITTVAVLLCRTPNNETLLLAAIKHQLEPVADRLCDLGVDVSVADSSGITERF